VCGIAGFTHVRNGPDADRIWEITRSLIHRGPDQQGIWESGEASLGAVRLKIIDLEHGDQPMASDDGDTVLVFNGELYNHMELRRELEQAGHRFHSRCDTETALHAFLEWDVRAFHRFRGMFAAAFWKSAADLTLSGSLNCMNPSADPASLPYVERFLVNSTGVPPTVPRCVTMPYLVRRAISVYDPAGSDEPGMFAAVLS